MSIFRVKSVKIYTGKKKFTREFCDVECLPIQGAYYDAFHAKKTNWTQNQNFESVLTIIQNIQIYRILNITITWIPTFEIASKQQ